MCAPSSLHSALTTNNTHLRHSKSTSENTLYKKALVHTIISAEIIAILTVFQFCNNVTVDIVFQMRCELIYLRSATDALAPFDDRKRHLVQQKLKRSITGACYDLAYCALSASLALVRYKISNKRDYFMCNDVRQGFFQTRK